MSCSDLRRWVNFAFRFTFYWKLNKNLDTIFTSEEILDAEENFCLGDELESAIDDSNRRYSGLKAFNKTRWGSLLMMSRSQLKNSGEFISHVSNYVLHYVVLFLFHSDRQKSIGEIWLLRLVTVE